MEGSILTYLTIDNIIKIIAISGGVISFIVYLKTELSQLKNDVSQMKDQQKNLTDSVRQLNAILTQIAVQDTRINMIEKDIDELRHNRGFIKD